MLHEIVDGRTDLVFDYLAAGHPTNSTDENSVSPLKWCAYYGDVSAIKFLLSKGESLQSLGDDLSLNVACFHGHWRLCKSCLKMARTQIVPHLTSARLRCTRLFASPGRKPRWW